MTSSELTLDDWATERWGKAARIAIAVGGGITATLVVLISTMVAGGAWPLLLIGLGLAATSVRAAQYPTVIRLAVVAANLAAVPLLARLI